MKQILILLMVFFLGCSGTQDAGHNEIKKPDTISPELNAVRYDSVINRRCIHQDLSFVYDYIINFEKMVNVDGAQDSCIVQVLIIDKKTHLQIDSLGLTSVYYYESVFKDCDKVWSYVTGKNDDNKGADNYFGDFCIADFNFDSMEDIAIVNDCSNSGQLYSFYIQDSAGKFRIDRFLTDSMQYFPAKIDRNNRTLVTYIFGGVCWIGEHKYKFDKKRNQWRQISHRSMNICEEN